LIFKQQAQTERKTMNKLNAIGLYISQNFFRLVAAIILHLFYKIKYIDKDNLPKDYGCVIALNHSSYIDAPLIGSSIFGKVFRFMARDTLFASLLANILLRSMGALPIKRSAIDRKAWDIFIQLIKSGQHVLIFPEGTRTPNGQLQEGKAGAGMVVYKTNAKVVPVYVHGTLADIYSCATCRQLGFGPKVIPSSVLLPMSFSF
jgi:1-acyl-sn-glycerol-3-phosphate acyltransferase